MAGVAATFMYAESRQPSPPTLGIERRDPRIDEVFAPNARLEPLKDDYFGGADGPLWVRAPKGGYLLFSDWGANRIYKWDPPTKQLSIHVQNAGMAKPVVARQRLNSNGRLLIGSLGSNGLEMDREGRIILCSHGERALVRLEKDGTRTTLADRFEGKRLNGPNDLVIARDGSVYFTDVGFQLPGGGYTNSPEDRELDFQGVFRWKTDGTLQLLSRSYGNGIAFSPDEKFLYTAGFGNAGVTRHEVQPDGTLANSTLFIKEHADGLAVDGHGYIFSSTGWVALPDGTVLGGIKSAPGQAYTNITFGDPDGRGIYVTSQRSLYHIRMKRSAWKQR